MTLKCKAHDCLHNQNSKCTASIIQVENCRAGLAGNSCATHTNDQGTYLLTAMERPSYPAQAKGIFNNEIAEEIDAFHAKRPGNPAILCGVLNCKHNRDKNCTANDVSIGSSLRKRSLRFPCKTFKTD